MKKHEGWDADANHEQHLTCQVVHHSPFGRIVPSSRAPGGSSSTGDRRQRMPRAPHYSDGYIIPRINSHPSCRVDHQEQEPRQQHVLANHPHLPRPRLRDANQTSTRDIQHPSFRCYIIRESLPPFLPSFNTTNALLRSAWERRKLPRTV